MRHEESIESLLQQVALKPPDDRLKQQILSAAQQVTPADASYGHLTLWRYVGSLAACLVMVFLVSSFCERQLSRWSPSTSSQSSLQVDHLLLEELGEGMDERYLIHFSLTAAPRDGKDRGDTILRWQELLEESEDLQPRNRRTSPPNNQSHMFLFESANVPRSV